MAENYWQFISSFHSRKQFRVIIQLVNENRIIILMSPSLKELIVTLTNIRRLGGEHDEDEISINESKQIVKWIFCSNTM
jgi:hypothetical protein